MHGSDFVYYSARSRKQRLMADRATSPRARAVHHRLAAAYADRAALAMLNSG
ncbi:hypothetical protein Q4610_07645 [Sphingobium sp. HBC34]|uniref:Uncharacterized protein n=1 Tax=Sphingobium cyanobacteriorum TaxID=3063954 RepID=A0ABT8ZK60_9SPHN|nr:hypothetical protein [Sphingobium sp. HBC34]MDO7834919.1 hypothetical protein [Sphingobium sp. HBC34]